MWSNEEPPTNELNHNMEPVYTDEPCPVCGMYKIEQIRKWNGDTVKYCWNCRWAQTKK